MKLNWSKHWFIILNVIAFFVALIDGFVWRNSNTGFPIFMILGVSIVGIVGGIYNLFLIFTSGDKNKNIFLELILLWFSFPFYGFIGATCGLLTGFLFSKF